MISQLTVRFASIAAAGIFTTCLALQGGVADAATSSGNTKVSECEQIGRNYASDTHAYNISNNYAARKGFQTMQEQDRADFKNAGCTGSIAVTHPG